MGGGGGTEIEYDCEEATRIEPLPRGTYPVALVGEWDCEYSDGSSSTEIINSDGTFFIDNSSDYPSDLRELWNQCRVGTPPPDAAGHWVAVSENRACVRYDVAPGIVQCSPFQINQSGEWISSPSDVIEVYQYGRLVTSRASAVSSRCVK